MPVEQSIPKELKNTPFYESKKIITYDKELSMVKNIQQNPFLFEILELNGIGEYKPWQDREIVIPLLLERWETIEKEISAYYEVRDRRNARAPMIEQLAAFIQAVYWSNHKPVPILGQWQEGMEQLKIKPVNVSERVTFVTEAPDHYNSFVQLRQLFIEFKKQYEKTLFLEKNQPS